MKQPKIIFFTRGIVPDEKEKAAIKAIPFPLSIRNASHIGPRDGCEPCAGVMGHVPKQYADFPDGKKVAVEYAAYLKERDAKLKALDTPAPGVKVDTAKPAANGTDQTPKPPTEKPQGWVTGN